MKFLSLLKSIVLDDLSNDCKPGSKTKEAPKLSDPIDPIYIYIYMHTNYILAQDLVRSLFLVVQEFMGWHPNECERFWSLLCKQFQARSQSKKLGMTFSSHLVVHVKTRMRCDAVSIWVPTKLLSNIPSSFIFYFGCS